MDTSKPSTSMARIGPDTMRLIKRIIRQVEKEKQDVPDTDALTLAAKYTGIHAKILRKIQKSEIEVTVLDIDQQVIRDALMTFCIKKRHFPTLSELYNVAHFLPAYVDIESFRAILLKMDYVLHKFKECSVLYVMEKKSVTFERYMYLKRIQRYRKDKRNIFFVCEAPMLHYNNVLEYKRSERDDNYNRFLFAASDNSVEYIKFTDSISEGLVKAWLIEEVIPVLAPNSVMVFDNSHPFCEKFTEVPTVNSVKVDMVDWLKERNIPCNIDMPKCDLISLIESCTDTNINTYSLDNVLQSHGHELLRLPTSVNGLSVALLVHRLLFDEYMVRKSKLSKLKKAPEHHIFALLKSISKTQLNVFSDTVIDAELMYLQEDKDMDGILDNLIKKTKLKSSTQEEEDKVIPSLSDLD